MTYMDASGENKTFCLLQMISILGIISV